MADSQKNQPFYKVFFIVSNLSSLDDKIEYSLKKTGMINLTNVYSKPVKHKMNEFTTSVYSFEFNKEELTDLDKDKEKKKYKAVIKLNQKEPYYKKDKTFEGLLYFKETKNNFIFSFKFDEIKGFTGNTPPPVSIKFPLSAQIKIYNEALKKINVKQGHPISIDLILDSQCLIIGQKYNLDVFLEIMKSCYSQKLVKTLLMAFKLERVQLPTDYKINPNDYCKVLNLIEKKPNIIIKYCTDKDNPEKYYKLFYSLLLYFRANFEKEKVQELLSNKNLSKYFKEIIPINYNSFLNIEISEELINEIIKQKPLSIKIIEGTFHILKLCEKILCCINENRDSISEIYFQEKKKIKINNFTIPNPEDNMTKIVSEIEKLVNYELEKGIFVLFEEVFFNNYTHYYLKKDLNKLLLIKKAILYCKKVDKELDPDYNSIIHETALEMIEKGQLKNEELLDFIEKEDIYFMENKKEYENYHYRPLSVLNGFDLDNLNDKFYEKWNKVNILKKYIFNGERKYYAEKALIDKINHMKDFGKLIQLFDNEKFCNPYIVSLLSIKYKTLISTYTSETCPNFLKESSLLIYMIDKTSNAKHFMEKIIEKDITSPEIINNIYLNLSSNYKDISRDIVDHITNFFIKNLTNKNVLKGENLLFLLKKLNSVSILKAILNKIKNYIIKEEELFNEEEEVDSFKLLEGIQTEKMIEKYPILNNTTYILSTINLEDKISNTFKNGEIKYNLISSWYKNPEKRKLLTKRLNILFFQNENDVKTCMDAVKKYFMEISQVIGKIKKLNDVLKLFYEKTYAKDIIFLDNFDKQIKDGNLNLIEKQDIQNTIKKMDEILPDLEEKNKLKGSNFFKDFFRNKKNNNPLKKEDDIFKETESDFNKLKLLFEPNWINNIDIKIIKECYKTIKQLKEGEIKKELIYLKNYFKLNDIKELDLFRIEDEIVIFSKKEEIFQTVNSCLYFIRELEAIKTEFSDQLKKLRDDLSKNIDVDSIRKYGLSLEKYGINILKPKPEDVNYLNILHSLYNKKGALKFIVKLTADDCRHLQEVVSESENTFLTGVEIQDMEKCSNFMNRFLGDKKVKKTDKELINSFINEVLKEKNISVYFVQYANNSGQIQELFSQKLDKSQATLKKIKNILKNSSFTLSIENTDESYFKFKGNYINEEKKEGNIKQTDMTINYDELIELRGRAMLTKKLGKDNSKEEKATFEINKKFAEKVNEIEKINGILKKIAEKGYSENIRIFVDIKNSNTKYCTENKKFNDYEECSQYFNKILTEITDIQIKYYKNKETQLIRYIYGRQFNLLCGCLRNLTNNSLAPFLRYLTNDIIEPSVNLEKIDFLYNNDLGKGNNYICTLENINNFLKKFLDDNQINLEKIYQQNIIKDKYKDQFIGLYTYLLEDDKIGEVQKGVEEHILNWYHFLTGHSPMAQTVLLCNEETTSEEITAFMYRAFLCQYHVIFMVGKIELLNPDKRQTLTGLINELFIGHEKEMKSCLAFAYSDKTATIVQYLERIRGREKLEHKDKKKGEQILYEENVEIISSDKSGVGKSTYIREQVKKKGKDYIHFPFGGEFSRKDVIERLKNINIKMANKSVIHLDLYDSKQTELMKDFLYSFLITKLYGQSETLFYLSKEVEIKIEIPNDFIDFFLKFPILSMFKHKNKMSIAKLPPLIVPRELNSNIQIVCNYLKLLKEGHLADKDLYIKNVSMDFQGFLDPNLLKQGTKIDAKILSQKECETLIKENIGIEQPTYYQINSFVNALSGQLKKFSINYSLSAVNLIQNGILLKRPKLKDIRVKMVNSFIKNTQHFTKGAFNKLLNSQMETFKVGVKQGNYDENMQDEVAIKALSEEQEIISFKKINPSLIFFHEGEGQDFSIISTCEPNEEEYKNLFELRTTPVIIQNEIYKLNKQQDKVEELPKSLNNYSKFTPEMFFKELKNILQIKNPTTNSEKTDNKMKSIEEIVGEYVFTADNFIKMILILLRIRENIPVIMMGETGCGKTSLIRKLSELINNGESKMKILNIHAGITDKEIVNFLYEQKKEGEKIIPSIIKEAEELQRNEENEKKKYEKSGLIYFEKKIWIFLDEINTCNCMGLICEMMTKHSCQGKPLPKSIVFIGACNPYRMVVKDEEPNGLKIEGTKERKLVYTVNPLPHSLLNFIFNFGNLTPEDEQSYIRNMVVSPIESFYWNEIENKNKEIQEKQKNEQEKKDDKNIKEKQKIKNLELYLSPEEFKQYNELKDIASNSIIEAQKYVREKNDVSSVSLREIRRFSIFYKFFVEYLRKKRILFGNIDQKEQFEAVDMFYKNLSDYEIYKYSINLSVYVCYYLRLTKKAFREDFSNKNETIL